MEWVSVPVLTYVLALEDDCVYVGKTYNFNMRLGQHMGGTGSKWTRLHKPTGKILEIILGEHERETTLRYMREHGWEKVRGAG